MTCLVDANVLSGPTRPSPDPKAIAGLTAHEGDFVLDPIALGELFSGILALPRRRKRSRLEQWFETVLSAIDCVP